MLRYAFARASRPSLRVQTIGLPEGGNTFEQFLQIMRHGTDLDHLHPPCTTAPANPNCLFALPGINPVDGNLLQVMPWPVFNNMSDGDLLAIYTITYGSGPL